MYKTEKPFYFTKALGTDNRQTNEDFEPTPTEIFNARGGENNFSLEQNGFEWILHKTSLDVDSQDGIQRYIKDMESFLKVYLKAEHVYAYDYVVSTDEPARSDL